MWKLYKMGKQAAALANCPLKFIKRLQLNKRVGNCRHAHTRAYTRIHAHLHTYTDRHTDISTFSFHTECHSRFTGSMGDGIVSAYIISYALRHKIQQQRQHRNNK